MSKEIDWSKAPEDATHFLPESEVFFACWIKPGYSMREDSQGSWVEDDDDSAVPFYIPRPMVWIGGIGLPPVGTRCEHFGTADHTKWIEVEVIGHGNVRSLAVAFFEYLTGSKYHAVSYSTASNFRPLRTKEQIDFDNSQQEAADLYQIIHPNGKWHKLEACIKDRYHAAIEAGFRKETNK